MVKHEMQQHGRKRRHRPEPQEPSRSDPVGERRAERCEPDHVHDEMRIAPVQHRVAQRADGRIGVERIAAGIANRHEGETHDHPEILVGRQHMCAHDMDGRADRDQRHHDRRHVEERLRGALFACRLRLVRFPLCFGLFGFAHLVLPPPPPEGAALTAISALSRWNKRNSRSRFPLNGLGRAPCSPLWRDRRMCLRPSRPP